jgi:hemerythrin-like domain-containing protein
VKGILSALERGDRDGVAANLFGYAGVLSEHIKKEDEILYPWMDRSLSVRQVGEMFSKFREADERFTDARAKYGIFVDTLEETFLERSAEVRR